LEGLSRDPIISGITLGVALVEGTVVNFLLLRSNRMVRGESTQLPVVIMAAVVWLAAYCVGMAGALNGWWA
jgi:hypothetical protein